MVATRRAVLRMIAVPIAAVMWIADGLLGVRNGRSNHMVHMRPIVLLALHVLATVKPTCH